MFWHFTFQLGLTNEVVFEEKPYVSWFSTLVKASISANISRATCNMKNEEY
jgi:hypothetical protein